MQTQPRRGRAIFKLPADLPVLAASFCDRHAGWRFTHHRCQQKYREVNGDVCSVNAAVSLIRRLQRRPASSEGNTLFVPQNNRTITCPCFYFGRKMAAVCLLLCHVNILPQSRCSRAHCGVAWLLWFDQGRTGVEPGGHVYSSRCSIMFHRSVCEQGVFRMCLSLTDWMLQWRQLLRDAADCTAVWMDGWRKRVASLWSRWLWCEQPTPTWRRSW